MSSEEHRPDDPPPTGWMSTPAFTAVFRQHHEESLHSYIRAASMQYRLRVPLPYHYDVLSVANDFLGAGKPDVAVIMAQTACEIATDAVISQLLRHRNLQQDIESWITRRIARESTFKQDALYELFRALTGDEFKKTPLWQEYEPYIDVRNNIIHKGDHATESQAKRFCEIVLEIIHHFEAIFARVTAK